MEHQHAPGRGPRNAVFLAALLFGLMGGIAGLAPLHGVGFLVKDAEARLGRPLTPGSVAGVSRRTARRTTRRHIYVGGAAVAAAVAIGTVVVALPAQCTAVAYANVTYHNCSGVYYQPHLVGTQVNYIVVQAPPQ